MPSICFSKTLGLGLLACAIFSSIQCQKADEKSKKVVPFPQLFDLGKQQVKIVSEWVDETFGYLTIEEYIDLDSGRAAIVTVSKTKHRVLFQDGLSKLSYSYEPYSCSVKALASLNKWSEFDEPLVTLPIRVADQDGVEGELGRPLMHEVELRLPGVAGLWLFAASAEKKYVPSRLIYSGLDGMYRDANAWSMAYASSELDFHFTQVRESAPVGPSASPPDTVVAASSQLEMIQVKAGERVTRTINVLSIEYEISERERDEYFEVPAGYGCFDDATKVARDGDGDRDESALLRLASSQLHERWLGLSRPSQLNLEITATMYASDTGPSSDTVSVDMALASARLRPVRLLRVRREQQNTKTIYNHLQQVAYKIDVARGTCEMSHLESDSEILEHEQAYEHAVVRFENWLNLDLNQLLLLLASAEDFHLVKRLRSSPSSPTERLFYEGKASAKLLGSSDVDDSKQVRVVRVFQAPASGALEPQSVTIWVLDAEDDSKILESYQVNFVESRELKLVWPDQARTFDVSEECYLNNEQMRQGIDYAWVELRYAADARTLRLAAQDEASVKWNFVSSALGLLDGDFLRLPRVELWFDEDAFVLRALLLDLPPLQYIFNKIVFKTLGPKDELVGDDLAPDIEHCAHLCRLNHCTMMSYCEDSHRCLTSARALQNDATEADKLLDAGLKCAVWLLPDEGVAWTTLHSLLARLQHVDYDAVRDLLPVAPDELLVPLDESGLSWPDYHKLWVEYQSRVYNFLHNTTQLPELMMTIGNEYVLVLPSKVDIEQDPLNNFDLNECADCGSQDGDNDDYDSLELNEDNRVPAFHKGLPMVHLKLAVEVADEQGEQVQLRYLGGLSYDQCALACKDGRCGTFSYCLTRHECVLSSASSADQALRLGLVESDVDCYMMQRDFLSSYTRFSGVPVPASYRSKLDRMFGPSECAFACASESSFVCLSFEFCREAASEKSPAACYLQTRRGPNLLEYEAEQPSAGQLTATQQATANTSSVSKPTSTCDHYSRSHLADFHRFESRKLADAELARLLVSTMSGLSVSACAQKCVVELADCTGFQSCDRPPQKLGDRLARECTFFLGRRKSDDGQQVVEQQPVSAVVDERTNKIVEATKALEYNSNCQVFSLRKDSIEAHVRDLALGGLVSKREQDAERESQRISSSVGLTLGGAVLLYVCMTLVSVTFGCALVYLRDTQNRAVRSAVDRIRIALGV